MLLSHIAVNFVKAALTEEITATFSALHVCEVFGALYTVDNQ